MEPIEVVSLVVTVAYYASHYLASIAREWGHLTHLGNAAEANDPAADQILRNLFNCRTQITDENAMFQLMKTIMDDYELAVLVRRIQKLDAFEYIRLDTHILNPSCTLSELGTFVTRCSEAMSKGDLVYEEDALQRADSPIIFEISTTSYITNSDVGMIFSSLLSMMLRSKSGPAANVFSKVEAHSCDDEVGLERYNDNCLVLRGGMRYTDMGDADFSAIKPDVDSNTYIIGATGSGKSTVGNALMSLRLYGGRRFRVVRGSTGTYAPTIRSMYDKGKFHRLIDTPGLADQSDADIVYLANLRDTVDLLRTYSQVVIVFSLTERKNIMREARFLVAMYKEIFGAEFVNVCFPVFTFESLSDNDLQARKMAVSEARKEIEKLKRSNMVSPVATAVVLDRRKARLGQDSEQTWTDLKKVPYSSAGAIPKAVASQRVEVELLQGLKALPNSDSATAKRIRGHLSKRFTMEMDALLNRVLDSRVCEVQVLTDATCEGLSVAHIRGFDGATTAERYLSFFRGRSINRAQKISLHWRLPYRVENCRRIGKASVLAFVETHLNACKGQKIAPMIIKAKTEDGQYREKITVVLGAFKEDGEIKGDVVARMKWLAQDHAIAGIEQFRTESESSRLSSKLLKIRESTGFADE